MALSIEGSKLLRVLGPARFASSDSALIVTFPSDCAPRAPRFPFPNMAAPRNHPRSDFRHAVISGQEGCVRNGHCKSLTTTGAATQRCDARKDVRLGGRRRRNLCCHTCMHNPRLPNSATYVHRNEEDAWSRTCKSPTTLLLISTCPKEALASACLRALAEFVWSLARDSPGRFSHSS